MGVFYWEDCTGLGGSVFGDWEIFISGGFAMNRLYGHLVRDVVVSVAESRVSFETDDGIYVLRGTNTAIVGVSGLGKGLLGRKLKDVHRVRLRDDGHCTLEEETVFVFDSSILRISWVAEAGDTCLNMRLKNEASLW